MKRQFKQVISCVLILTLVLTFGTVPAFAKEKPTTEEALKAEIKDLYASEPGLVGRTHKMQAFIMELALHAKSRNPDFKIIPQDGINLAFIDGDWNKGVQKSLISLVDGWGIEGMVGNKSGTTPNDTQKKYMKLVEEGLLVTDTTVCETQEQLDNYYARASAWGIIPYPRIGGALAQELFPGKRWAENGDYFWVEDPDTIGIGSRIDGARDVDKLTDAQNYLYNINGRPYDAWETWDDEEAAVVAEGEDGDRTRIYDSYGCGLLVPSAGGEYRPVAGEDGDPADVADAITVYGPEWDWWWREAGLAENAGRETWLNALRESDYDVIYIDSFYNHRALPDNQTPLTKEEIDSLKVKPDGGRRQVIAYLSIGSAEQNRWYCQDDWVWVDPTNPNTERSMKSGKVTGTSPNLVYSPPENAPAWLALGYGGNYAEEAVVQWWNPEWRDIIINGGGKYKNIATGDNTSSIDRIINQGFDGVYLDNVGVYSRQSARTGGWNEFEAYWLAHGGIPGEGSSAPLVSQDLDYTENPVDVPNPDRGFYRGRWQRADTPFGTTPEVDHRVPVDESSVLYHGRQMPPVEGDDIEETQPYNGTNVNPYVGGTGVSALPAISFMGFDLCNFSSNAFLSRQAGLDFDKDPTKGSPESFAGRTGKTQPLTPYALDYIRGLLQKVRDGNSVAFVKFSYDGNGFNYVEGDGEHLIFGPEPTYITANNPSAMCDVPGHTDKTWIEYHIWQLKPILQEYEDVIMCVKTGMLGPWGEQHTSPEARNPETYKKMLDAYLDAVPASRMLLTHGGGFLAWYNLTYGTHYDFSTIDTMPVPPKGSPEARFGFFNDSYAAGYDDGWTDNGSLPEGSRMFSPDWDPVNGTDDDWWDITDDGYDRYKLTTWINKQNSILQGEGGIGSNVFGTFPGAILEAQQLRTTALNMRHGNYKRWSDFIYNEENVTKPVTFPASTDGKNPPYTGETKTAFFDPVYDGKTGLEYFRDRLGYRLVLREAKASEWVAQDGILKFEGKIQNVGFGNIVNKKNVSVILKSKTDGKSYMALTNLDARDWRPDLDSRASNTAAYRDLNFSINMSTFGELPAGDYDIYLKINDPKETTANKRSIRFANKGDDIWDAGLGANLIGSTTVKSNSSSGSSGSSGSKAKSTEEAQQTTTKETLKDGTVVTTTTDNATGNQTITVKSPDGTVAEISNPRTGVITGKITLGSGVKRTVVSIPMKNADGGTVVIIVHKDGTEEIIKNAIAEDGVLYVPVTGDVTIKIVQNGMSFNDANQAAWAKDAIAFVTARELFLGTGNGGFSPNRAMTRGMLATVLYRLAGEPTVGASGFSDVTGGKYSTDAVAWAAQSGIVTGIGSNLFAPDREITREQLAAMLYRFAGSPGGSGTLDRFNDGSQVSEYARQASAWAIEQGIIQGRTGTAIVPKANATRAEVATMLQRFIAASITD